MEDVIIEMQLDRCMYDEQMSLFSNLGIENKDYSVYPEKHPDIFHDIFCEICLEHTKKSNLVYYVSMLDNPISISISEYIVGFDDFCVLTQINIAYQIANNYGISLLSGMKFYSPNRDTDLIIIRADFHNIYLNRYNAKLKLKSTNTYTLNEQVILPRHDTNRSVL